MRLSSHTKQLCMLKPEYKKANALIHEAMVVKVQNFRLSCSGTLNNYNSVHQQVLKNNTLAVENSGGDFRFREEPGIGPLRGKYLFFSES